MTGSCRPKAVIARSESNMEIQIITRLPGNIKGLVQESEKEGFAFINRLKTEWEEASNCFDGTGEFLLSASSDNYSMGVCGINVDPYLSDQGVARLRHLYVSPAYRSRSIGSELVRACLNNLSNTTRMVRLRVPEPETGRFYEKLGFKAIRDTTATHIFTRV